MLIWILLFGLCPVTLCYKEDLDADIKECEPDCPSEIFCSGELLHDVQMSGIFNDGTTFVEKRLLYSEKEIMEKYKQLKRKAGGTLPAQQLRKFVDENFANDSLSTCSFPDFKQSPSILKKTDKAVYKNWLTELNKLWVQLGGELHEGVQKNPDRHSYMYVPHKFIKAGGRFTGTYYWDSYWITKGLLLSDMTDTARGMIENIIYLVKNYDHMPNGNRIYYWKRSQPPMLIQMVAQYYEFTKNDSFIKANLKYLDKEFDWWVKRRSVLVEKDGKTYKMFRYKTLSCTPRPESYAEDYELIKNCTTQQEKTKIYTGVRSAAETGWDFSSRHMRGPTYNSNDGNLRHMDAQNMVYVDINSILQSNAQYLKEWHEKFGTNKTQVEYYRNFADSLTEAIDKVLWNNTVGVWLDFDLITSKHRNYFYVSNFTPLWSKSFKKAEYVRRVIDYLKSEGIIRPDLSAAYYCVPTSTQNSTQQWDYPNCWAPLQAFLIMGLYKNSDKHKDADKIALTLAQAWIDTTYDGFRKYSVMYEKYSAIEFGETGSGGEYEPQTGFGWTNGLCMDIFNTWGSKIQEPRKKSTTKKECLAY